MKSEKEVAADRAERKAEVRVSDHARRLVSDYGTAEFHCGDFDCETQSRDDWEDAYAESCRRAVILYDYIASLEKRSGVPVENKG